MLWDFWCIPLAHYTSHTWLVGENSVCSKGEMNLPECFLMLDWESENAGPEPPSFGWRAVRCLSLSLLLQSPNPKPLHLPTFWTTSSISSFASFPSSMVVRRRRGVVREELGETSLWHFVWTRNPCLFGGLWVCVTHPPWFLYSHPATLSLAHSCLTPLSSFLFLSMSDMTCSHIRTFPY